MVSKPLITQNVNNLWSYPLHNNTFDLISLLFFLLYIHSLRNCLCVLFHSPNRNRLGSSPQKKSVTRWARWVSRASGLSSPMVSDHEHNWGQLGPGGCHALRACGACGLPWSPIMSTIGAIGGVSRSVSDHEQGVTRFGPVVSHGLRS